MKRRRMLLLVPAVIAVAALVAVSAATARTSASSAIVIDGTTDTVTNIDPAGNYDFGSGTVDYQIFNRLLESGPGSLGPHPALATKCAFKGNLKTFACTLRKGVKFSNGDAFTSADVKFSFDRVIKIKDPSGISSLLDNLKSTTTSGAYGVVFHLKHAQSTWPNILTTGAGQIVDHNVYPADKILANTSQQVGTGPYMLATYTPGQQAVLKPNPNFWGPKPANGGVIINYYSKSSTMKLALEKGEIDMAFETSPRPSSSRSARRRGITVHKGLAASIRYLVMDANRAPTDNLGGAAGDRLPVPAADDRVARLPQPGAAALLDGPGRPARPHRRVQDDVRRHAEQGEGGGRPEGGRRLDAGQRSTLWYTPSHYGDASADEYAEIQRALNGSGLFKVTLKTAEWAQYVNTLGKTKGLFQLGWFPDYVDAEDYLQPFYPKGQFLSNGYSSPKMDALAIKEQGTKSTGGPARDREADADARGEGRPDHPVLAGLDDRRLASRG